MDLIAQLKKALAQEAAAMERRGVVVEEALGLSALEIIAGEEETLRACSALINNAVRFNRAGGKLYLWRVQSPGKEGVMIADTGVGMLPGPLKQLKQQAEQGKLTTGLGTVWKWLKASGGDWFWESQVKVGFQMTLQWPRAPKE